MCLDSRPPGQSNLVRHFLLLEKAVAEEVWVHYHQGDVFRTSALRRDACAFGRSAERRG